MVLKARDDKSQARVSTKAQPEAEKCTRPQFLNSGGRLRVASVLQRELTIQLHRQSKAYLTTTASPEPEESGYGSSQTVSYTHLTLPTKA